MSLALQDEFARALLDRACAIPSGVTVSGGSGVDRRFAVHRNNVASSLTAALASRFAAAERIVGTAFFNAMAQAYIARHPPRSPILHEFGEDLADFVEGFEAAASVPYLADVIRLEAARGRAYHAADVAALDPTALARRPLGSLGELTFALHPAASIIRSSHPIVTIWAMNTGGGEPTLIAPWIGENALVTRPHLQVHVRALPLGGGVFLSAIAAGQTLGTASDTALTRVPGFDLTANLTCMLQAGVVAAVA